MAIRQLASLFILVMAFNGYAHDEKDCDNPTHIEQHAKNVLAATRRISACPNRDKISRLCHAVTSKLEDKDPESSYLYAYQRDVYEASCADIDNDSPAEISRKVNIMWEEFDADLKCTSPHFGVKNGSIIKFAVAKQFREFIVEAAQVWKINLNKIDPADGITVLDFVNKEIERHKGNPNEPVLRQYYSVLRKAGAKHKSEL